MSPDKEKKLRQSFRDQVEAVSSVSKAARSNSKSIKWFKSTIQDAIESKTTTKPTVGKIYTFVYDAKHKKTLPYWDRFPLSVCFSVEPELWRSINLHYIPKKARMEFLENLLVEYANRQSGNITKSMKLNIDWGKLKSFNRRIAEHAVTSYRYDHIKSPIREIDPREWAKITALPTQQFMSNGKKYSARKVWSRM